MNDYQIIVLHIFKKNREKINCFSKKKSLFHSSCVVSVHSSLCLRQDLKIRSRGSREVLVGVSDSSSKKNTIFTSEKKKTHVGISFFLIHISERYELFFENLFLDLRTFQEGWGREGRMCTVLIVKGGRSRRI